MVAVGTIEPYCTLCSLIYGTLGLHCTVLHTYRDTGYGRCTDTICQHSSDQDVDLLQEC